MESIESKVFAANYLDRLWSEYRIGTADEISLVGSTQTGSVLVGDNDGIPSSSSVVERMRFDAFAVCLLDLAAYIANPSSGQVDGQGRELKQCIEKTEEFLREILQEIKGETKGPPYIQKNDVNNILRRYFQILKTADLAD